jgi:glycosyltransferase involved in cell wall biosynthesis
LVIVGDAPYAEEYKSQLRALADERTVFTGFVFGEGYAELSSHCRAFVLPSAIDGTRPVLLDQMGFGNCLIVRDSPANAETVGDTAIFFEQARERESLREQLQRVADQPEITAPYRVRAQKRIRSDYDWERITERYLMLFRETIADPSGSSPG